MQVGETEGIREKSKASFRIFSMNLSRYIKFLSASSEFMLNLEIQIFFDPNESPNLQIKSIKEDFV